MKKQHTGVLVNEDGSSTFRVWAPFADEVYVQVDLEGSASFPWSEFKLEKEENGHWVTSVIDAEPGHQYRYRIINGEQELFKNDPCAKQLTAVNGTSIITDPDFEWNDQGFVMPPREQQVIYELHVGSFNRKDQSTEGTFYDAIEKLDHLTDLGVNVIELMPVSSAVNDHGWGYAPEYIYAVESAYGGRHGLLEFVNAAHQKGLAVILDVVYNHFLPSSDSSLWRFDGWYENDGGGIYFYNDWRGETPWGPRPDFGRSEVRNYILNSIEYWMNDCHIDGFRVDSTLFTRNVYGNHHDPSTDLPDAWLLFQEINSLAKSINKQSLVIAEDYGQEDYITRQQDKGGAGFDAQWAVEMPYAIREALINPDQPLHVLLRNIDHTYNGDFYQRVVFYDSHDSAANGAARINQEADTVQADSKHALNTLRLASKIILTLPGTPMILQGMEFAQYGGFEDWHALDWELLNQNSNFYEETKAAIELRKNHPALISQNIDVMHIDHDNKVIAYRRWADDSSSVLLVVINIGNYTFDDYEINNVPDGEWIKLNESQKVLSENNVVTVKLRPKSIYIFEKN